LRGEIELGDGVRRGRNLRLWRHSLMAGSVYVNWFWVLAGELQSKAKSVEVRPYKRSHIMMRQHTCLQNGLTGI
jgi:hypothetical protein